MCWFYLIKIKVFIQVLKGFPPVWSCDTQKIVKNLYFLVANCFGGTYTYLGVPLYLLHCLAICLKNVICLYGKNVATLFPDEHLDYNNINNLPNR